jgi:hypothetical protein
VRHTDRIFCTNSFGCSPDVLDRFEMVVHGRKEWETEEIDLFFEPAVSRMVVLPVRISTWHVFPLTKSVQFMEPSFSGILKDSLSVEISLPEKLIGWVELFCFSIESDTVNRPISSSVVDLPDLNLLKLSKSIILFRAMSLSSGLFSACVGAAVLPLGLVFRRNISGMARECLELLTTLLAAGLKCNALRNWYASFCRRWITECKFFSPLALKLLEKGRFGNHTSPSTPDFP